MDDYSITSLSESKNEWCARLVDMLSPAVIEGIRSIFKESYDLCVESDEEDKYLMTFQTLLSRIPKWNVSIIDIETKRIEQETNCGYLEDLITCVHVIQLKALTCVRVGQKQKNIEIDIPSKDKFIHNVYINTARKLYTCIYLFEKDIAPLQIQKNNRELDLLTRESIFHTIRDTMPLETILRAYMDTTEEEHEETEIIGPASAPEALVIPDTQHDTKSLAPTEIKSLAPPEMKSLAPTEMKSLAPQEMKSLAPTEMKSLAPPEMKSLAPPEMKSLAPPEIKSLAPPEIKSLAPPEIKSLAPPEIKSLAPPEIKSPIASINVEEISLPQNLPPPPETIRFSDTDLAVDQDGIKSNVSAPKTIERLEQISSENSIQRKLEDESENDDKIKINTDMDAPPLDLEIEVIR